MTNPTFDFGVFVLLLALSLAIIFVSNKIGCIFLVVSIVCFVILGYALVTGYDVVLHKITNGGGLVNVQEDDYLITNTQNNQTVQWLGFVFFTFALIISGKFVLDLFNPNVKLI